jgi:hypothetical protein
MPATTATSTLLLDTESATRLRMVIGRLSRLLRATPSGMSAGLSPTRISLMLAIDRRGPITIRRRVADSVSSNSVEVAVVAGMRRGGREWCK